MKNSTSPPSTSIRDMRALRSAYVELANPTKWSSTLGKTNKYHRSREVGKNYRLKSALGRDMLVPRRVLLPELLCFLLSC